MTHNFNLEPPVLSETYVNKDILAGKKLEKFFNLSNFIWIVPFCLIMIFAGDKSINEYIGIKFLLFSFIPSMFLYGILVSSLFKYREGYLPSYLCKEILDLCEKHPEIEQYRKKVIFQNRQLTCNEYCILKNYADWLDENKSFKEIDNKNKEYCKKLYNIS